MPGIVSQLSVLILDGCLPRPAAARESDENTLSSLRGLPRGFVFIDAACQNSQQVYRRPYDMGKGKEVAEPFDFRL